MRIVVVGAGPAGVTLSLLLARHGADVRLLEREPALGAAFRGEGLLPLGLDALQQMGLGAAVRDVPGRVVTRWRICIDGDEVLTVPEPVAELGERAFRIVSPAALLGRVLDAAGEFPNFSFHPDTRFTDVVRSAGRVVGVGAATGGAEVHWVGRARSWSAPGVLLLGDAAHPMSPVRAQGINLALRDVIVAANHLVPLLTGGDQHAVDEACRAIQAERGPEVRRAQQLQRREARGQGDARAATWRYALAKRGAVLLGRYAWAQRAWLRRQHELRFGSVPVTLRLPGGAG